MARREVEKLSPRHERIALWLIANPEKKLKECSKEFDVSMDWLSIIINSAIFRDYLKQCQKELQTELIMSITDKANGTLHRALEKLAEKVEQDLSPDTLLDVIRELRSLLGVGSGPGAGRGGFAPQGAGAGVPGGAVFVVTAEALEEARGLMRVGTAQRAQQAIEAQVLDEADAS